MGLEEKEDAHPGNADNKTTSASLVVPTGLNKTNDKKSSKSAKSAKSAKSNTKSAAPKLPSAQARRLTIAYKALVNFKEQGSAKGMIRKAIKDVEIEIGRLKEELELVNVVNEEQARLKEEWATANIEHKEKFIVEAKKALRKDLEDDSQEQQSISSSVRLALAEAEKQEAMLLLEQQQLAEEQELKRRQREEELKEHQRRSEVQRKLEGVKARRKVLSVRGSKVGSDCSSVCPIDDLNLPEMQQPTEDWLEHSRASAPPIATFGEGHTPLLVQQLLLSQVQVPKFNGDPLEYLWFKRSFEEQVERATHDSQQRLYQLLKCLGGEALTLVRGCQLAPDPAQGYSRAKELLQERYGHPIHQGLLLRDKLLNWPTLRTNTDLRDFSIQLSLNLEMKKNGATGLQELDAGATILKLASKLTSKTQTAWQNKVVEIETKWVREARFEDFVQFVKKQERARNHPIFGKLDAEGRTRAGDTQRKVAPAHKAKTFEVEAQMSSGELVMKTHAEQHNRFQGQPQRTSGTVDKPTKNDPDAFKAPCLFCKEDHPASKCAKELSCEEKCGLLKGLCFSCLKPGHSARTCRFRLKCEKCGGLHPTVLHEDRPREAEQPKETPVKEKNMLTGCHSNCIIATIPVQVWASGGKPTIVRALIDPASTATFVCKEVVQELGAAAKPIHLTLNTLSSEETVPTQAVYGLSIADLAGNEARTISVAYEVEALPEGGPKVTGEQLKAWTHLRDLPLNLARSEEPVQMLIGLNVQPPLLPIDSRPGGDQEPSAVRYALGWALQGPVGPSSIGPHQATANFTQTTVKEQLQALYYRDFQDAFDFHKKGLSQEDKCWMQQAEKTVTRGTEGRYTVSLPFKPYMKECLHDNYKQAIQRLQGLKRKFDYNHSFKADYCQVVKKMVNDGHVEEAPELEPGTVSNYIPHHGVYHPQKPGKIRVVFNCANKFKGIALNDCLISGPDLTSSIVGVLLRFRQYRVPFVGDIEAMFYQVLVPENDRDVLRFVWWQDGNLNNPITVYRMRVHLFGATSSPSVANFALRRAAQEAHKKGLISDSALQTVQRNFYVDDCLKSTDTEQEAVDLIQELITACGHGKFKLCKFLSPSITVLRSLDKSLLAASVTDLVDMDDKNDPLGSLQERALGVAWSVANDCFEFRVRDVTPQVVYTKRTVLSQLSSVYDPLGFAAPVLIGARTMFRQLTVDARGWDEELSKEEALGWQTWTAELRELKLVKVPRWLRLQQAPGDSYQVHVFCDASTQAYGAVAYIRTETGETRFVFGKARVAPPKIVTVPRLELTAAKLATDVVQLVEAELEITVHKRVLWTDSQTVLKYLHNRTKRFHVFVANRIQTILSATELAEWRYVPTHLNPADEASRGLKAQQLNQAVWLRGPEFLTKPECEWPPTDAVNNQLETDDPEVRPQETINYTHAAPETPHFVQLVAERCSSMLRFRRAIAVWLRVRKILCSKRTATVNGPFQASELKQAENAALRAVQSHTWPREIVMLEKGQQCSWLRKLSPVIQDGLLKMRGRLGVDLPIVPAGRIAKLLLQEAHVQQGHQGRESTASFVRQRYWVLGLRKTARSVANNCKFCSKQRAKPAYDRMAALPACRIEPGPPFHTTGIDFFGPFWTRKIGSKAKTKSYGVIFSCAVSRAVHLELAESLDKSSFINALKRFIARRGHVSRIISDNGSNLEGGEAELRKEIEKAISDYCQDSEVVEHLRRHQIDWQFNPPAASHYGGFYERLIQSVRRLLAAVTSPDGRSVPTTETLTTLLCECESILNNRPLTVVSDDPNDLEPLTPNHLLLGRSGTPRVFSSYPNVSRALKHRWKFVQHLTHQFWLRWTSEYRSLLHARSKWTSRPPRSLQPDDVVLVLDPVLPRKYWKLGRIVRLLPSKDGISRVAEVKTATSVLNRPITKLCRLETDAPERAPTVGGC